MATPASRTSTAITAFPNPQLHRSSLQITPQPSAQLSTECSQSCGKCPCASVAATTVQPASESANTSGSSNVR